MAHIRRHAHTGSEPRRLTPPPSSEAMGLRRRWPPPDPRTRVLPDFGSMELWFTAHAPGPDRQLAELSSFDLPALTARLSNLLARLRQEFGVVYRSRTWIDEVLPIFGGKIKDPTLTRDVLAIAALDAGGVRADVSGVAGAHTRDEIIAVARELVAALESLLADCAASSDGRPIRLPDQSSWPAW